MAKRGSGGYDVILNVGANFDPGNLQKDIEKALQGMAKSGGPLDPKMLPRDFGKAFSESIFGKGAVSDLQKKSAALQAELKKLANARKDLDASGKLSGQGALPGTSFLNKYKAITDGLSNDEQKLRAVEKKLKVDLRNIETSLDGFVQFSRNMKVKTRGLDLLGGLTDEKKLGLSDRTKGIIAKELAAFKDQIKALETMRKNAAAIGDKATMAVLDPFIFAKKQKLKNYEADADFKAATDRVVKATQNQADSIIKALGSNAKAIEKKEAQLAKARSSRRRRALKNQIKELEKERALYEKEIRDSANLAIRNSAAEMAKADREAQRARGLKVSAGVAEIQHERGADLLFRKYGSPKNVKYDKYTSEALAKEKEDLKQAIAYAKILRDQSRARVTEEGKAGKVSNQTLDTYKQQQKQLTDLLDLQRRLTEQSRHQLEIERKQKREASQRQRMSEKEYGQQRALAVRHKAGLKIISRSGGLDNFDPSRLNYDQAKMARQAASKQADFYQRQAARQSSQGVDASSAIAQMERYAAVVNKVDTAHKTLHKRLGDFGILMKNFVRFAVAYQSLYQVLNYITGMIGDVVRLEAELANIQAITATTTDEMKGIAGAINDVAIATKFSTAQIAEAAKVISQAGVAAKDLPGVLRNVADFAAATDSDLGVAADIISSVREVYKDMSEADIANQLTKAVNLSKLSGQDLQTILSLGAQVAEGYNITSEQFLSAVTVLRNAGIKASTVATGLRQAMLEIFNPDDPTLKALQTQYARLGEQLSIEDIKAKFYNFQQAADPLLEAVRELKRLGFGGEGDYQLGRGFDTRALNVMKELVKSQEQYLENQGRMNFGQPAAEGSAKAMNSLSAAIDNLNSALTALLSESGAGFLKWSADVVRSMTSVIEEFRTARDEARLGIEPRKGEEGGVGRFLYKTKAVVEKYGLDSPIPIIGPLLGYRRRQKAAERSSENLSEDSVAADRRLATISSELEKAQQELDSYDPESGAANTVSETIRKIDDTVRKVDERVGDIFSISAGNLIGEAEYLQELLSKYSQEVAEPSSNTMQVREQLLEQIRGMTKFPEKVSHELLREISNAHQEVEATSVSLMKNYQEMYRALADTAENGVDEATREAAKATRLKLAALRDSTGELISARLLRGDSPDVEGDLKAVLNVMAEQPRKAVVDLTKEKVDATLLSLDKKIAEAAAQPSGVAEQELALVINDVLAEISNDGTEAGRQILERISGIVNNLLSDPNSLPGLDKNALSQALGMQQGQGPLASYGIVVKAQERQAEVRQKIADSKFAKRTPDHPAAEPTPTAKDFVPDVEANARASQLEFQIEKLKKFGDATGQLTGLIQERASILEAEKRREIENTRKNLQIAKETTTTESEEYKKARKELADQEIELQKLELTRKEDYLDAMATSADRELSAYDSIKENILAAGGNFDGLASANAEYTATQQRLIDEMKRYMRDELQMSEAEIEKYIKGNDKLTGSLLTDNDINAELRRQKADIKAAKGATPTLTTGNAALDAKARAGLGFTDAEKQSFYLESVGSAQREIEAMQRSIAANEQLMLAASEAQREQQLRDENAAYAESIKAVRLEIDDLNYSYEELSSTAAGELASVFNEEGIRKFTTALQESGNVLKDWGDNIRNSLLTAWDSVGNAITDAIAEGKDFEESMREIAHSLATDILRTTTKNILNNSLLALMGQGYGTQAGQPGSQPGAAPGAAATPAAGGILGKVASMLGLGTSTPAAGGAGQAVGTMTVNAGVVNVNGGAAAAAGQGVIEQVIGNDQAAEAAPSLFDQAEQKIEELAQGAKDKFSQLKDGLLGSDGILTGLWDGAKSLLSNIGGGASGAASSAGEWIGKAFSFIGGMFARNGAIIPDRYSKGYVKKSGKLVGPGTGRSDSLRGIMMTKSGMAPIAVSSGESILTAKATSLLGEGTIKALNSGTARKFATGGMVDRARRNTGAAELKVPVPSVTVAAPPPQNIQMINTVDSPSVVEAGLDHPATVKKLVNVIRANKSAFRQVLK